MVVLVHARDSVNRANDYHLPGGLIKFTTSWLLYGNIAVSAFLVISGYSLFLRHVRPGGRPRSTLSFYKRRLRRIVPTYWAAIAFSALMGIFVLNKGTGTIWDYTSTSWVALTGHAFFLQDLSNSMPTPNYAFWSIAIEEHLYILFPLLAYAFFRASKPLLVSVCVLFSFLWFYFHPHQVNPLLGGFLGLLVLGMTAVYLAQKPYAPKTIVRFEIALALTLLALGSSLVWASESATVHFGIFFDYLAGVATVFALIVVSSPHASITKKIFESRSLTVIGVFSYSLYLVHAPLIQFGWQTLVEPWHLTSTAQLFIMLLIVTPLTVLGARVFFRYFEKPFL